MDLGDVRTLPYLLAFQRGVTLTQKDGTPMLQSGNRTISLQGASNEVLATVEALSSSGASEQMVVERVAEGGVTAQAKVLYYLARFKHLGLLTYSATSNGQTLATLTPTSKRHTSMPGDVDRDARYALSRFVCLRRKGKHFVLESPLGHAKLQLFDARASALCHLLAEPRNLDDLSRDMRDLSPEEVAMLLGLLLGSGAAATEHALDHAR